MAITTIPWNDGSGDNLYVSAPSQTGSQTVTVSSDENKGSSDRTKTVTFTATANGQTVTKILTLIQEKVAEPYIVFADPLVEQICATNWGDGVGIRPSQAATVTDIGTVFKGTSISSFDEFATYFTNVTSIKGNSANANNRAFYNCTSLRSITIPASVTSIGALAFQNCSSLQSFVLPSTVTTIDSQMFYGCTGLKSFISYRNIGNFDFAGANQHVGDGTGTLYIDGNFDQNYRTTNYLDFNTVQVTGNVTQSVGGSNFLFNSSYMEKLIIGGDVNRTYRMCNTGCSGLKFIEIGGTYNMYVPPTNGSNIIVHLKYNGIAGTPSYMIMNTVSKVYVDNATVLAMYQADSAWSSYTAKLDLWENYSGVYKD